LAIEATLASGFRSRDIYRGKGKLVGSKEMTDAILANLSTKTAAVH
jgi:hypothetical protein